MNNLLWSPWHGCKKCSPGCLNCYVYYLDSKRGKDASIVTKSITNFNLPLKKSRNGEYKIPSGSEVATCFTSDFFLPEADPWRDDAWKIMKIRSDVTFLICTKRIERFDECIPSDWCHKEFYLVANPHTTFTATPTEEMIDRIYDGEAQDEC